MRLLIHDFGGYPFSAELADELARRGFDVIYSYSSNYVGTRTVEKSSYAEVKEIRLGIKLHKYHIGKRLVYEVYYGLKLRKLINQSQVQVLLLSTTPLISTLLVSIYPRSYKLIIWHQDVYSQGMASYLAKKLGPIGRFLSSIFKKIEILTLNLSDAIIYISRDFANFYKENSITPTTIYIPNWSPIQSHKAGAMELVNPDSMIEHVTIVYAGTLGQKHDSEALIDFFASLGGREDVKFKFHMVTQNSEFLDNRVHRFSNISFIASKPLELDELRNLFNEADFGLVYLTKEASYYSLPSKIYTHAVNHLPTIGLVDTGSESAKLIVESGGIVASPTREGAELLAREISCLTESKLIEMKRKTKAFADLNCDVQIKGDEFEKVILSISVS